MEPIDWPLGPCVRLLLRDPHGLVAFDKPAGVLSHPNESRDTARSLLRAAYREESECFSWPAGEGREGRLWLLNRLDSATSGVLLAAESAELAAAIKEQFVRREIHKVYLALVFGRPRVARDLWRDRLAVEKRHGQVRTRAAGGALPSESQFKLLRSFEGEPPLSLIELQPKTGRSHQLRVQCSQRRLPIVGDATYGDFRLNRAFAKAGGPKRLFLHSRETAFRYSWRGREVAFAATAEPPPEFLHPRGAPT